MTLENFTKTKDLQETERELNKQIRQIRMKIEEIQKHCSHENKRYSESGSDPHSGKRDDFVRCLDCGYGYWD